MIDIKTDKDFMKVEFRGDTHTIYKELMSTVCHVLNLMHLERDRGTVPLSDSITEFGQHLILLSQKHKEEFDLLGEIGGMK